ncbi:MAG: hypothetical protein FH756_15860 [Firmicutes bacterium]|nr:hypothetical protein [Bacillota bacterium]
MDIKCIENNPAEIVDKYIQERFDIDKFKIDDFSLMPHGKLLTDSRGQQILIFYDILTDTIKYRLPFQSEEQRS